jgi:hypothetical protein
VVKAETGTSEGGASSPKPTSAVLASEVERLRIELMAARAEIARLEEENEGLRSAGPDVATRSVHLSQRAPRLFPAPEEVPVGVDGSSPPEDKIRLFRSLFAGRTDVYAQRWENPSTNKAGWVTGHA